MTGTRSGSSAFVEFIVFLALPEKEFDSRYNSEPLAKRVWACAFLAERIKNSKSPDESRGVIGVPSRNSPLKEEFRVKPKVRRQLVIRRPKPATMWGVLGGRIVLFGSVGKGRDQVVGV